MATSYTDSELSAYLDEDLPQDRMSEVENALRNDQSLVDRLTAIVGQRDAGLHTLGAIWRRERLSCPDREQLGSFLLGILDDSQADYIRFHLSTIGCRVCNASLEDLRTQHAAAEDVAATESRRRKYFQSSAGYLSSNG